MNVLFFANTAWSIYNFRFGLVKFLIENGFSVTILVPRDEFFDKLKNMGCIVHELPISAKGVNPIEDILLIFRVLKKYRTIRPDFIIHYTIKPNIYGSIAARIANIPSIAVTTGLGYTFIENNVVSKIAKFLYKFAFKTPNEVWFLNEDDREVFLNYHLVDKKKAFLLCSEGVNTNYFIPTANNKREENFTFLLIARMLWDKGIAEYVEAARIVHKVYPNVIFQLLGATGVANPSAISPEQIEKWIDAGDVEHLGTAMDVRPLIAQADCVVLPSYREGIPRTMMEAASMAKPLIATDCVGCRDVIIEGKTGFLCQVKDSESLALRMIQMIEMDEKKRLAMGLAGRRFMIEQFDETIIINQYINTLSKYGLIPEKN